MKTIQIETSSKNTFEQKFNLFKKKVKKMNLTEPSFSYGETYRKEKIITYRCEGEDSSTVLMLDVIDVHLDIDSSYKLNGWELISVVLFQDGVILPIDVNVVPPSELGLKYTKCDHCGGNHSARKKSFIVKNDKVFKQVGSTCSKEFLGMSESIITNLQVMFADLIEMRFTDGSEDEELYCKRTGRDKSWIEKYNGIDLNKAMSVIAQVVSEFGYEKQRFAQIIMIDRRGNTMYDCYGNVMYENVYTQQLNKETATLNIITPLINSDTYSNIDYSDFIEYVNSLTLKTQTITEYVMPERIDGKIDYTKLIEEGFFESVKYFNGFDSSLKDVKISNTRILSITHIISNYDEIVFDTAIGVSVVCKCKTIEKEVIVEDFNFKLKQLVNQKMVLVKDLSTLAAGYASYLKFKQIPETNFIGNIGDKKVLKLNIVDIKTGNGQFGVWTLYTLNDVNGNIFTKFGTINSKFSNNDEVKIGSEIHATFEIKEHKEFNMIKQTVLGRLSKI